MWFSGEDRLRKGPKEMEEQKQAERQWNKIRRERINILKEAPSEENLWQAVMAFQDYPFKTVTGLPFQYTLKTGKNGEWTKELWIDRREKSKSLSWSSVVLAFKNSRKTTEVVERPKALGDIRGISYIYPILWRLELIRVPEKFEKKMACDDEKNAKGSMRVRAVSRKCCDRPEKDSCFLKSAGGAALIWHRPGYSSRESEYTGKESKCR